MGLKRHTPLSAMRDKEEKMEQLIEEYGISAILLVVGSGVVMALGQVLKMIAGV